MTRVQTTFRESRDKEKLKTKREVKLRFTF